MLGNNIKIIRKKKKLTLSECANRANISKSYLSNIERNVNQNPSIHIIYRIATVLDVDLRSLIDSDDVLEVDESEWFDFMQDLKKAGIEKEELQQYKTVIEFAKWQKEQK